MNTGLLNATWGKTIIDQFVKQGVTYFCHCPGFRSSSIALAIAEDPRTEAFVHFDERGACFHALGYAKATGKPAAVVVTSGTALGNLMPAVMEAWAANIPLILLTCDRPHELRDTSANQTCDQIKIFGDYVRAFYDFPTPNEALLGPFLAGAVAEGVLSSMQPLPGPVQFNLPFSEPFFDEEKASSVNIRTVKLDAAKLDAPVYDFGEKKGGIVVGAGGSSSTITQLAKKLNWPIFCDIISGHREKADPHSIAYYHHILKSLPNLEADIVLHFGGPCVSKALIEWMSKQKELIHISPFTKRVDPLHGVSERVICAPEKFCQKAQGMHSDGWLDMWKGLQDQISLDVEGLCEPNIVLNLLKQKRALFIGNSMPIRDADMFFFPEKTHSPIFANRGLSGIDGNIATICGIAHEMPVTGVIGDQTFLHDLNSLAQISKTKHPVKLIVINNGGGGIFSFVAIGKRKDVLDPYFAAAHEMSFEKSVEAFGLSYECVDTLEGLNQSSAQVIEVKTSREENLALHKNIDQTIQKDLCSSFSTVS